MHRRIVFSVVAMLMLANPVSAQVRRGKGIVPESSIERLEDLGVRMHTNYLILAPEGTVKPAANPGGETPASLGCIYDVVSNPVTGCLIATATEVPTGGSGVIVIVDAYDDPSAAGDMATFSTEFGLPAPNFLVKYASGTKPANGCSSGWEVEESLDIEWAHAMAPGAKIYLVEAASSGLGDLLTAVSVASQLVAAAGGGEVSMSWGGSEFSSETAYDKDFTTPGVVYLASAGDSAGVIWPSSSPNVVSVGGTALSRNPTTGIFQAELAWQQGGGGPSAYESRPTWQSTVSTVTGAHRGTPDIAAVADPTTGVWVYDAGQWYIVGGTSVAAPVWAGILNAAGHFYASSAAELTAIYGGSAGFNTIANGDCGPNEGYLAQAPWSFCTGHGSPNGKTGK